MIELRKLQAIAEENFADIVSETKIVDGKIRIFLIDTSYIDFWWSAEIEGRFAHHYERGHIDGTIYRHDNMPHLKWAHISTFPQHYHEGSKDNVIESFLVAEPSMSVMEFLRFARRLLTGLQDEQNERNAR
ncbi:hypothetical protein KKG56_01700 [bacterium]|nr:hypothetical protein [bacterium]